VTTLTHMRGRGESSPPVFFLRPALSGVGAGRSQPSSFCCFSRFSLLLSRFLVLRAFHHPLDEAAGDGRRVKEQHAARRAAAVLPGMRNVAWHERTGAGPAFALQVADLAAEFALE